MHDEKLGSDATGCEVNNIFVPIVPTDISSNLVDCLKDDYEAARLMLCRIFSIDKLSDTILQESIPLTYTPKRLVKHPDQPYFYTI